MQRMKVRRALLGSIVVLVGATASANDSYGDLYIGTSNAVRYGSAVEIICDGLGVCSRNFTVQLERGMLQNEVVLTGYYANFRPQASYKPDVVRIEVSSGAYNSSTGELTWTATAELGEPTATATGFEFGVYVSFIQADFLGTRLYRRTSVCNGDTDTACSQLNTYSNTGTSTIPFQQMAIRGFEFRPMGLVETNLERIMVDVTGHVATGSPATTVTGTTVCAFIDLKAGQTLGFPHPMDCTVQMVAIASPLGHMATVQEGLSTPARTDHWYEYAFTAPVPGWSGFFLGLQSFGLGYTQGPSHVWSSKGGCFAPSYPAHDGSGDIEYQWFGDLADVPTFPHAVMTAEAGCFEGFIF